MLDGQTLRDLWSWEGRRRASRALYRRPHFTEQGLEMGAETILARAQTDRDGCTSLDLENDLDQAETLLSIAYERPIDPAGLRAIRAASEAYRKSDPSLAYILLAQAGFDSVENAELTAMRLYASEKLLERGIAPAELVKGLEHFQEDWLFDKASPDDPKHPGWPKGAPDGKGGQFRSKPGIGHNQGPPLDEVPTIPSEAPVDGRVVNAMVEAAAKWLIRMGLATEETIAPEVVIATQLAIEAGSWAIPRIKAYVSAYFDGPKTLEELQVDVKEPAMGYEIHHIVEQTSAEADGFPRSQIDAPDNLVRISAIKHQEITDWYNERNYGPPYNGLSPRRYLKGKSWEERRQAGLEALRIFGVLKP